MEGRWNILAFYDLEHYFDEFEKITDGLLQLNQRCSDLALECESLASQFAHRVQVIRGKNEMLEMDHLVQRKRRAVLAALIGGAVLGGMAYHWLTKDESSQYAKSINDLRANQDHLLELIRKQTSVLDITGDVMKQNFEQMRNEHAELRRDLFRVVDAQNRNDAAWKIQNAATQYALMLETYADVQNRIIDAIMNMNNGHLHPTLVPANQLRDQLQTVLGHLPARLKLPGHGRDGGVLLHIFRTARVKIGFSERKLIFQITIPLLKTTPFWIWRLIPIPTMLEGEFMQIKTINDYLLVDIQNTTYYDLKREELRMCTDDEGETICELHHPLYKYGAERGRCEMRFIRNEAQNMSDCGTQRVPAEETWIQLDNLNTWIFSMDHPRNYTMNCEEYGVPFGLTGTGLLTFVENCTLEGEAIHLASHQMRTRMTAGFTAAASVSLNVTEEKFVMESTTVQLNFSRFDDAMRVLRSESSRELLVITTHNWHYYHYAVIYGFAVMGAVCYVLRRLKSVRVATSTTTSGPGECVELQIPQHEA